MGWYLFFIGRGCVDIAASAPPTATNSAIFCISFCCPTSRILRFSQPITATGVSLLGSGLSSSAFGRETNGHMRARHKQDKKISIGIIYGMRTSKEEGDRVSLQHQQVPVRRGGASSSPYVPLQIPTPLPDVSVRRVREMCRAFLRTRLSSPRYSTTPFEKIWTHSQSHTFISFARTLCASLCCYLCDTLPVMYATSCST